ncbi:retroviral aspartyl protease [Cooperia oncophora]
MPSETLVLQEVQEEATQKTQHTKEKFSRNRNNRGPRKQVRIVKIANAAVQANSSRVYIDAVVNNYSVKFLLDTGSDITLLNEKIWKKMGSPALEKTNIVVKNASGDSMKIYGKLKCKITMKGVTTEGDAYVTPYNSLLGLEWIRANENLMYHIEMMAAEVKANCNPRRKEELKTLKRGARKLKREEKLSEDTFNVIRQAHRTTTHRCLEDRTESLKRLYAEENGRKMKQQYDRRNGSISKEFHKGDDVYAQMWKAPHSTWKQGVVAKRLGAVGRSTMSVPWKED